MKLIKIAPDEIVNLEAVAHAKYDDGAQRGTAAKGHVSLTVVYQSGEERKFQDDAAKTLWEIMQGHCQSKSYA